MPKGIPNARYTGDFKQQVVEDIQKNQKIGMSVLELGIGIGGVALAFVIANCWNPVGWLAAGVGLAYTFATAFASKKLVEYFEEDNKKKYGW